MFGQEIHKITLNSCGACALSTRAFGCHESCFCGRVEARSPHAVLVRGLPRFTGLIRDMDTGVCTTKEPKNQNGRPASECTICGAVRRVAAHLLCCHAKRTHTIRLCSGLRFLRVLFSLSRYLRTNRTVRVRVRVRALVRNGTDK